MKQQKEQGRESVHTVREGAAELVQYVRGVVSINGKEVCLDFKISGSLELHDTYGQGFCNWNTEPEKGPYNYGQGVLESWVAHIVETARPKTWARLARGELDEVCETYESAALRGDAITGNASGSFWFNSRLAGLCLVGNEWLAEEALAELYGDEVPEDVRESPETVDVQIRCHIAPFCLSCAVRELSEKLRDACEAAGVDPDADEDDENNEEGGAE